MFKRIIIISLGLAALLFLIAGYFYLGRTMVTFTDPVKAVSVDAVAAGRVEDLTGFLAAVKRDSVFWNELGIVLNAPQIERGVWFLDSLFSADPRAYELAAGKSLYFSLHPVGRDNYDVVFYSGLASGRERKGYNELMGELIPDRALVSERIYHRVKVYDVSFRRGEEREGLSWTISEGIFMLSFSPLLIENAIKQLDASDNLFDDEAFRKVYMTRGSNVAVNLSVNMRNLPAYLSSLADGGGRRLLEGHGGFADWAELDFHLRENALLINGFSYAADADDKYLNVFMRQSPVPITAESVIPGYSSAFLALGLSDIPAFHNDRLAWLAGSGGLEHYNGLASEFRRLTGSDAAGTILPFMEEEAVLVLTDWEEAGKGGESFLLIKTRSRAEAGDRMQEMLRHHAGLTGRSADSYRQVYQVDRETTFDIYSFPFDRTGELLFGKIFGTAETAFYSFAGNYLVFGESFDGLSEFLRANVLNQTLSADSRYREFSGYLSARNNLFFYSNVARSAGLFTALFNERLSENLTGNLESFRKFKALSLQFSTGRDMIYNNIFLNYSPTVVEEAQTEWRTLLDTVADFKPLLLVNHNTGENEIFIQDINNTIYLINNAGRILWKKPLPGRIMGNVYQIDYFNNNHLQMLFNTREQIFLIDRNGNDVERYPVRLPSPATNGISVFDYDINKDYRIFVAGEDKSVTVRSKEGNIVSGWNFRGSEHIVQQEIRHLRVDGRDYIVFADRNRVYMLDRRGNTRVRTGQVFPVSPRNSIVFEGRTPRSEPRLALTDTLGKVWHIYFDGRMETKMPGQYSSAHFFDFQDMNADGYRDYIFVDDNLLEVFSRDGSLLFRHEFPERVSHPPAYYYFSREDRKLGIVLQSASQIYLLNSDGEIYQGFPLIGRSLFTIGFLAGRRNFNLLVGSDDNFLYNYLVY